MGLMLRFLPFLAALAQYETYAEQGEYPVINIKMDRKELDRLCCHIRIIAPYARKNFIRLCHGTQFPSY